MIAAIDGLIASVVALFTGLFGLVLSALVFVFWLWMLVDCIRREKDPTTRVLWALVIVFLPCIGSLVYALVRKLPRR